MGATERPLGRYALGRNSVAVRKAQPYRAIYQFPPGTYTFVPPQAGYWKFVIWGPGGGGFNSATGFGSGSGGYCEVTRFLNPSQPVTLVVSPGTGTTGAASTATFSDATVVSAGPGVTANTTGAGGAASGGDVNLNGSQGGSGASVGAAGLGSGGGAAGAGNGSGAGAPAVLPYRGGVGGIPGRNGGAPGAGAGEDGAVQQFGGSGMCLVTFARG